MLMPKRVKHRKQHRGRMKGKSKGGVALNFGDYGLFAKEAGWITSRQTKPKMLNDFIERITREDIRIYDARFLDEAYVYLSDGHGGGAAKPPNHDDLVTAVLIAVQGALDVGEYPISWKPDTVQPATYADVFQIGHARTSRGIALGSGIGQTTVRGAVRRSFMMKIKED